MRYDLEALSARVKAKRVEFLISFLTSLAIAVASAVCAVVFNGTNERFAFVLCAAISLFYVYRSIKKYRPVSLFGGELRGINVKEHEYVTMSRGPASASYRILYPSHTGGTRIHARLYLKSPDGQIKIVRGLYKAQTDVYEIGDELLRPAGATYPVILSRDTHRAPCPDCGRVNGAEERSCTTCGLPITE